MADIVKKKWVDEYEELEWREHRDHIDTVLKEELEEPKPTERFLKHRWLAPIQAHTACRLCTGLCCRLSNMHVCLTHTERARIIRGELDWKVEWSVPHPRRNRRYRSRHLAVIGPPPDELRKASPEQLAERNRKYMEQQEEIDRQNRFRFAGCGGIKGHPQETGSGNHQVVWYLAKKKSGACLYLNEQTGRCSIYHNRPHACQSWFCGTGEKSTVFGKRDCFPQLWSYAEEEGLQHLVPVVCEYQGKTLFDAPEFEF